MCSFLWKDFSSNYNILKGLSDSPFIVFWWCNTIYFLVQGNFPPWFCFFMSLSSCLTLFLFPYACRLSLSSLHFSLMWEAPGEHHMLSSPILIHLAWGIYMFMRLSTQVILIRCPTGCCKGQWSRNGDTQSSSSGFTPYEQHKLCSQSLLPQFSG